MDRILEHDGRGGRSALAIGVDLGGTKIEVVLVDGAGRIVERARRPTNAERGAEGILADIVACVTDAPFADASEAALGIGIGVAGQVDPESGLVRSAPNLRWRDVPMRARLEQRLSRPVLVMNDVQAATYAEWTHGVGRGVDDLVCVFVGTGVGGGIIAGGEPLSGCSGNAGEIGHIVVDLHGPSCSCGSQGCLEALVGGWAIARAALARIEAEPDGGETLRRLAVGDLDRLDAALVADAFHKGDALARRLVQEVGQALGAGLATIANAFNPKLIVLGGGVMDGLPELKDLAEQAMRARALEAASRPLGIVKAALGADAGAIGAAARIRDAMAARAGAVHV